MPICCQGSCPTGGLGQAGQHEEEGPIANRCSEAHWPLSSPLIPGSTETQRMMFCLQKVLMAAQPCTVPAGSPCPPARAQSTFCSFPSQTHQLLQSGAASLTSEIAATSGTCWVQNGGRTGPTHQALKMYPSSFQLNSGDPEVCQAAG